MFVNNMLTVTRCGRMCVLLAKRIRHRAKLDVETARVIGAAEGNALHLVSGYMADRQKAILVPRKQENPDEELVSLCKMMRIMSERDTDATLAQVLKTMMVSARDRPVGGSELSQISGLNRITVIHHLRRLEGAGFVRRSEGKYLLRVQSAEEMLLEFRKEMDQAFAEMDELAREIDGQFEAMDRQFALRRKRQ